MGSFVSPWRLLAVSLLAACESENKRIIVGEHQTHQ